MSGTRPPEEHDDNNSSAMTGMYKSEVEADLYDEEVERRRMRPVKRNNLKKTVVSSGQAVKSRACPNCNSTNHECGGGFDVCRDCGRVLGAVMSRAADDGGRCVQQHQTDARLNYLKERLSQWCCAEPAIPVRDMEQIRATYNMGLGPNTEEQGLFYDPNLPKETVRDIIVDAGLSPRKYVEKWLTIRVALGAAPRPKPSQGLMEAIINQFKRFNAAWKQYPELHPGRKSMICYNFFILQVLLMIDVELYKLHAWTFPLVEEPKAEDLKRMWAAVARRIGWPVYFASIRGGEVYREEEPSLSTFWNQR